MLEMQVEKNPDVKMDDNQQEDTKPPGRFEYEFDD